MNLPHSEPAAGLDYGSNSLRLLIATTDSARRLESIHRERVALRLAPDAFGPGRFSQPTIEAVAEVSSRFAQAMDNHGVVRYRAVGTEAFRRAGNADEAVESVRNQTGIQLEILETDQEASLVMEAVRYAHTRESETDLLVDMGGGSLELIASYPDQSQERPWLESHPLGLVAHFVKFLEDRAEGKETRKELSVMAQEIGSELNSDLLDDVDPGGTIALVGGQAEMLEHLALTWGVWEEGRSKEKGISLQQFDELCLQVVSTPTADLLEQGVSQDRAQMLPGAAALYQSIAHRVGAESILLPCVGLIEGLLISAGHSGKRWPAGRETSH